MKASSFGVLCACLALIPASALGDGGFIAATAFEKVQIPDQRALIHFADGKETLVLDTAFRGTGTNFAWIIPVPSVPTVELATTGLFTTLQSIFQPKIVHDVPGFYWLELFLGCVIALVMWKWLRRESAIWILLIVCLIVIFSGMLLPALGTASVSASSSQVGIIEKKRVGIYDTVTLKSPDGQAVFDWLKQNGFVVPTNVIPDIRAYAQEGWCFVASKIRLDTAKHDAANPHPLALKFQTTLPVYPLRLTAINNDLVRVELYIFGPSRSDVPYFTVERCAAPSYPPDNNSNPFRRMPGLRIRHPLLRSLVMGSPVATKLTANLTNADMHQDAYVTWAPFREKQLTRYSVRGALAIAANIATPVLIIGLLTVLRRNWAGAAPAYHIGHIIVLGAVICGLAIFSFLPKTQVVASRLPGLRMHVLHSHSIPTILSGLSRGSTNLDVSWFKQKLEPTSDFRKTLSGSLQTNLFTGELWRDEDSPGNCSIQATPTEINYLWYDIDGGEHVAPLVP